MRGERDTDRRELRARSGASRKADPDAAAREVADALSGMAEDGLARAALVFATEEYGPAFDRIAREISSRAGIATVVGCSAAAVVAAPSAPQEGAAPAGISALALAGTFEVDRFLLPALRGRAEQVGREIGRLVAAGGGGRATVVLFADSYNLAPDELLGGISDAAGFVPVIGAGASEKGGTGVTSVFTPGASTSNAVCGLVLRGIGVEPVTTPVAMPLDTWWTITSGAANRVYRLDGAPALDRILAALPASLRETPEEALGFVQVALAESEDEPDGVAPLLRPIVGVDPDEGSVLVGDEVLPGWRLALAVRDPARARDRLGRDLSHVAATPSLAAMLYVHGALGGDAPYGLPDLDTAYLRQRLGDAPFAGFASYVTFAPRHGRNRFHHSAGLLAGLAPPLAP